MAHVKVERRSMSDMEWINIRFGWLKRRIVKKSIPIEGWQIKEARQIAELDYEFYDKEWRSLKKGDTMFSPDGTVFMQVKAKIPAELKGEKVWFALTTTSEMLVKSTANGRAESTPTANALSFRTIWTSFSSK